MVFDLAVAIRQPYAPLLTLDDLPDVKSAPGKVYRPREEDVIRYHIEVSGENCKFYPPYYDLLLHRGKNQNRGFFKLFAFSLANKPLSSMLATKIKYWLRRNVHVS